MKKLILFSVLIFAISTAAFAQSSFQMPLGTFSGSGKIVGKAKHNFSEELIYLALEQFKKENLLEKDAEFLSPFNGLSRREVVKKVGLDSMIGLPIIASIVAPTAINAASGCTPGLLAPGQPTVFVCAGAVGDCSLNNALGCRNPLGGLGAPPECCSGAAVTGTCTPVTGGESCACLCA